MIKVAVLVSGGGTNLQAIIDRVKDKTITNAEISVVISNNPGAFALKRAEDAGIKNICISPKDFDSRDLFNKALIAVLDKEKVEFPLTVRVIHSGDRFLPYGMKGTKLVSDYLTDKKISLWTKQSQMVITDNKDDIVWLVGHRIDHRFRITSSTSLVLKMELQ